MSATASDGTSCYIALFASDCASQLGGVYKIAPAWWAGHSGGPVIKQRCGTVVEQFSAKGGGNHKGFATLLEAKADLAGSMMAMDKHAVFVADYACPGRRGRRAGGAQEMVVLSVGGEVRTHVPLSSLADGPLMKAEPGVLENEARWRWQICKNAIGEKVGARVTVGPAGGKCAHPLHSSKNIVWRNPEVAFASVGSLPSHATVFRNATGIKLGQLNPSRMKHKSGCVAQPSLTRPAPPHVRSVPWGRRTCGEATGIGAWPPLTKL